MQSYGFDMNYFILLKCYEKTKANFIHSLKHLLTCFLRHNFKFLMVDVDVLFTDVNVLFIFRGTSIAT